MRRPSTIIRTPSGCALLNVGCGTTFSTEWTNVDLAPSPPHVAGIDLRKPLPFPDDSFDAIYSSHVLEHFTPDEGAFLLREMTRCLVPGGACRVVVPDLEIACREYLAQLEAAARRADGGSALRHEWAVVTLIDQFVRERSGGRVRALIASGAIDEKYVRRTNGDELIEIIRADEMRRRAARRPHVIARLKDMADSVLNHPRRIGELHRWGYDRLSLGRLMASSGLSSARVTTFDSSEIPDWDRYALDSDESGRARKRGSLFMEGRKPAR
jgi:predicted SAM-dependent methyltransferase